MDEGCQPDAEAQYRLIHESIAPVAGQLLIAGADPALVTRLRIQGRDVTELDDILALDVSSDPGWQFSSGDDSGDGGNSRDASDFSCSDGSAGDSGGDSGSCDSGGDSGSSSD